MGYDKFYEREVDRSMAANNRRTSRSSYDPRGSYSSRSSVDGNLARRVDPQPNTRELERRLERSGRMDFDELYERRPETAAERNARRRAQLKASIRTAQRVSPVAVLGAACVAALMVVLLLCHVRLNTISRSIVSMKAEISALEVEQVSLRTQYEQTFDLSAVKEAAEAAGMYQPSDSQVYYISLPGEDKAQVYRPERGNPLKDLLSAIARRP